MAGFYLTFSEAAPAAQTTQISLYVSAHSVFSLPGISSTLGGASPHSPPQTSQIWLPCLSSEEKSGLFGHKSHFLRSFSLCD